MTDDDMPSVDEMVDRPDPRAPWTANIVPLLVITLITCALIGLGWWLDQ